MRESLGKIAEQALGADIVFLRKQPDISSPPLLGGQKGDVSTAAREHLDNAVA
jgi:hypothetical protein